MVDTIMESRAQEYSEVIANLTELCKQVWPNAEVETYGSISTNLALPSSDIDLFIELEADKSTVAEVLPSLRKFSEIVESSGLFRPQSVKFIESAVVPVIKFLTKQNVPVDITCLHPGFRHNGKESRNLVRSLVRDFSELRPLVLVLKQRLNKEGLNNQVSLLEFVSDED